MPISRPLLLVAVGLLAACAAAPPPQSTPATQPAATVAQAVVADHGDGGTRTGEVTIVAPQEKPFGIQAVQHRWVANDVNLYRVTLEVYNGTTYVPLSSPLSVDVPQKPLGSAKTKAVFHDLKQGSKYQASVVAMGDVGGNAATGPLNSVPATSVFDFTGANDVQDTIVATPVLVVFDSVAFSGTGTVTLDPPATGAYADPNASESATVQ